MSDHFVIVGAQRSGTSYLCRLLDEHPEIEMAKPWRPEPKFFLDESLFARGREFYESRYFSDAPTRVRGEKSTSYIESDIALRRIDAMFPAARVVVMLRDPVHRALSNYRFSVQNGLETLTPEEALRPAPPGAERPWDKTRVSVSPYAYLARGRYVEYLERLADAVDPVRIDVLLYEELVTDAGVVRGLYERLGVDPEFRPEQPGAVVNASAGTQSFAPELTASLREFFREPNQRLAAFLGRDLPWPA